MFIGKPRKYITKNEKKRRLNNGSTENKELCSNNQ